LKAHKVSRVFRVKLEKQGHRVLKVFRVRTVLLLGRYITWTLLEGHTLAHRLLVL
jgi:hypothetical protein